MNKLRFSFWFFICLITMLTAGPWPGELPGVEIGSGLPSGYEPSGAVWHTRLNKLFTVWDNGMVSSMDYDGTNITNWTVAGDLEAITIADSSTDFVYVGVERPDDGILEFNFMTGQTTRFFNLTPWMQSSDPNLGLEALTFVPDTSNPEGGLFYAGLQENSNVYIFQLPIKSSATDTTVTYVTEFNPTPGRPLLSDMDYERRSNILYAIWGPFQKIRAMDSDGIDIVEWDLVGDTQEGVALWHGLNPGEGQIFIAEDAGQIWRYDFNSEINITLVGNGSVFTNPDPPSFYGTNETLYAVPDSGYCFIGWSGDLTGTENPAVLLMDYTKNVTAHFLPLGVSEKRTDRFTYGAITVQPNPFTTSTTIEYAWYDAAYQPSQLTIYDISGRVVKNVVSLDNPQQYVWDGTDNKGTKLSAGVYVCEVHIGKTRNQETVTYLHE